MKDFGFLENKSIGAVFKMWFKKSFLENKSIGTVFQMWFKKLKLVTKLLLPPLVLFNKKKRLSKKCETLSANYRVFEYEYLWKKNVLEYMKYIHSYKVQYQ